uniref:NADH-ubiquinone oxidoreductase chain 4L n=1 Tax=Harengula jaguana TaxID=224705 RepID=H1UC37_HARJA|nr:NADH dehydrogenase subunit 4L [Harengula jaguana]WNH19275.1 NADH dehydrogenase subunit 4L [Harengula clupeola]BAL43708.1 NADH dehydrogenase subunit 4L [Harengula jaguana]
MTLAQFSFSAAYILGLVGLAFHRSHLISALLCLEAMMLSLFMGLALWVIQTEAGNFSVGPITLLAFAACEASAGLALLVATARTHGSDRLQSLNLLQC